MAKTLNNEKKYQIMEELLNYVKNNKLWQKNNNSYKENLMQNKIYLQGKNGKNVNFCQKYEIVTKNSLKPKIKL